MLESNKKLFISSNASLLIGINLLVLGCLGAFVAFSAWPKLLSFMGFAAVGQLFMLITWISFRLIRGKFNIFEPMVPAVLMLSLLFGIRPIAMLIDGNTKYYRWIDISNTIEAATLLGLLSTIAYFIGYEVVFFNKSSLGKKSTRGIPVRLPLLLKIYLIVIVSISLGFYLIQLHAYGGVLFSLKRLAAGATTELAEVAAFRSEYLTGATIFSSCAATLLIIWWRGRPKSIIEKLLIISLIIYPASVYMMGGDRRFLIPSVGIPIVAYYLVRLQTPSIRRLFIVSIVIFPVLVAIPFIRQVESRIAQGGIIGYVDEVFSSPGMLFYSVSLGPDTEMLPVLAAEMTIIKDFNDYYWGKASIGDILIAPIPSALIPEKPITARNQLLIEMFESPCIAKSGGLCPDWSAVGTFYQDMGWLGALSGMLIMGLVSGIAWRSYLKREGSATSVAFLCCWTIFFPILLRAGFMPGFQWFLYFWIPIRLGIFLGTMNVHSYLGIRESKSIRNDLT